jgi:hypothetical protein
LGCASAGVATSALPLAQLPPLQTDSSRVKGPYEQHQRAQESDRGRLIPSAPSHTANAPIYGNF